MPYCVYSSRPAMLRSASSYNAISTSKFIAASQNIISAKKQQLYLPASGGALEKGEADKREECDDGLHFGSKAERTVESFSSGDHHGVMVYCAADQPRKIKDLKKRSQSRAVCLRFVRRN